MTQGVPSRKTDTSHQPKLDQKVDIPVNTGKSGALKIDGKASAVKQLRKQDIRKPVLVNVNERHGTLRPQLPRSGKFIGGANRTISPSKGENRVEFQVPPKSKVEAHSFRMKGALASLGGITGAGIAIGAAAGSVVPVFGTAFGAVVGFVIGGVVGHLVKKYGRSHSHRRYFQNAIKSLEDQHMRFTPQEKKRLEIVRPEQWKYLMEKGAPIIHELTKFSTIGRGKERWAKQFFYQYAAMYVAKIGYRRTQFELERLLKIREKAYKVVKDALEAKQNDPNYSDEAFENIRSPEDVVTSAMNGQLAQYGIDATRNLKAAQPSSVARTLDEQRSEVTKNWDKLFLDVKKEFGETAATLYKARHARHYAAANNTRAARQRLKAAMDFWHYLPSVLRPFIGQYDKAVQTQVLDLVGKYAFDIAVGDVSDGSFYDRHGSVDKQIIEEFIGTAARLQGVRDRTGAVSKDRLSPDIVLRHATLENRVSSYADACNGMSDKVYARFIGGAADIYDECAQLLKVPENNIADCLRPFGDTSSGDIAKAQAKNLRQIAELAGRLKAGGADRGTARMILRMEARERAYMDGEPELAKDIKVVTGWSPALNANPEADLPRGELLVRAGDAAAKAERLHEALQDDSDFYYLTQRDAEDIYFQLLGCVRGAGYRDNEILTKLRENDFSSVKEILRSGTDVGAVGIWLHRGARSLKEAIECARLRVNMADVLKVADIDKTELDKWHAKGFTDVEIAAYRGWLSDWGVLEDGDDENKKIGPSGFLTIDDERMASFHNSNLSAEEANNLLALGLVKNADSLSVTKPRHLADAHVLSDKDGGDGAFNHVNTRTTRRPDGTVETRVFKPIPISRNALWHEHMKRRVGSNLAASMVNEELGFEAIVHTEMSTRNGQIGISMELAKGHTGSRLRSAHETFVTVPKDVVRYQALHKAVDEDLAEHGAISVETRKWATEKLGFTRLRMVGDQLQATGDFLTDLLKDAGYREKIGDYEINLFLNDELDSHASNYIIDVQLGPNGATAAAVKGIDNDGGFAAWEYVPQSLRTMPRVMSRRQADAIIKMYENKDNVRILNEDGSIKQDDGIIKKLEQVVLPSTIHVPVKPDVAFPFKHSREATAANLPPPADGNQVKQFEERLKMLYDAIRQAEAGNVPDRPDGYPPLTIITGGAPKNEVKDKAALQDEIKKDNQSNIVSDNEYKEDISINDNNDLDVTWTSDRVTKILTNTASIFARDMMRRD